MAKRAFLLIVVLVIGFVLGVVAVSAGLIPLVGTY
jgi:hypothetical protein